MTENSSKPKRNKTPSARKPKTAAQPQASAKSGKAAAGTVSAANSAAQGASFDVMADIPMPEKSLTGTEVNADANKEAELRAELAIAGKRITELEQQIYLLNQSLISQGIYATQAVRSGAVGSGRAIGGNTYEETRWFTKMVLRLGPQNALRRYRAYRYLRGQGLFDARFYSEQIGGQETDAGRLLRHYIAEGFDRRLDPIPNFNVRKYLEFYPDVEALGAEPLSHFQRYGKAERRVAVASSYRGVPPLDSVASPTASLAEVVPAPVRSLAELEARPAHGWKLAQKTSVDRATLGLYDVRPEDDVPVEGASGEAFLSRFGLLSDAPDYKSAVAYLNALTPKAKIETDGVSPVDVSIVIPVYGQLNYTLNCLHALLTHTSTYRFEIIVGDDVSPDASGDWLPKLDCIRYLRQPKNGGFIENCNLSGELATGRWIVMLNNDTRVVAGWLDEMIDSFTLFPKAGLVGSKLFYPDGSLQEAGGIIWKDGSAWNYGRGDDPNRPRYCYAREVDYISGCSIALPTELWRKLKGFDTLYKPAYCEDSDLCFRVRAEGLETWFQPLSRVIHYEGKTSGTDLGSGAKAYQVTNSKKLYERWKDVLATHRDNGVEPWFEHERKVTKRVLVVDATNPTPWMDAGSVTTTLTIKIFQAMGYKVYFVPQDNHLYEPRQVRALQRTGVECAYAPYEVFFSEYVRVHGPLFDLVQVFRFPVAEKIVADIRTYAPQAKILFNNMDLHFLRMEREARLSGDEKGLLAAEKIKARELDVVSSVDCTIVPSTVEAEILHQIAPDSPVEVFPYMTDYVGTDTGYAPRRDILFLGGYGHAPNVDAVEYFVSEIWPLLKDDLPQARYVIAGAKPTKKILSLAGDRIIVTGMVDDLGPLFDQARVFAATIRYGAGVKGKVSTSMAHGLPVVATDCASEGMNLVDGRDALIANDPVAIAAAIKTLYNDSSLWTKMSRQSLTFVKKNNSFEMGIETIQRILAAHTGFGENGASAL